MNNNVIVYIFNPLQDLDTASSDHQAQQIAAAGLKAHQWCGKLLKGAGNNCPLNMGADIELCQAEDLISLELAKEFHSKGRLPHNFAMLGLVANPGEGKS